MLDDGRLVDQGQLVDQRQEWLLERVESQRRVSTTDAAARLEVSVDTIRRDLRQLHERGLLRRVHGGAIPLARLPNSFTGRADDESYADTTVAAAVVERFKPGQVIGLDGGTTCVDIATMIPASLSVTIVTNNPAAALALAGHRNATVIMLGGLLDLTWMTTTGAETVDGWRQYQLDIAVLGVCGIDPEIGITTGSPNEVATKRALIASATDVVVPLQRDKIGVRAPFVIAGLDALDLVIAVDEIAAGLGGALAENQTEVILSKAPS